MKIHAIKIRILLPGFEEMLEFNEKLKSWEPFFLYR